jgi:hypothetical protein
VRQAVHGSAEAAVVGARQHVDEGARLDDAGGARQRAQGAARVPGLLSRPSGATHSSVGTTWGVTAMAWLSFTLQEASRRRQAIGRKILLMSAIDPEWCRGSATSLRRMHGGGAACLNLAFDLP